VRSPVEGAQKRIPGGNPENSVRADTYSRPPA